MSYTIAKVNLVFAFGSSHTRLLLLQGLGEMARLFALAKSADFVKSKQGKQMLKYLVAAEQLLLGGSLDPTDDFPDDE